MAADLDFRNFNKFLAFESPSPFFYSAAVCFPHLSPFLHDWPPLTASATGSKHLRRPQATSMRPGEAPQGFLWDKNLNHSNWRLWQFKNLPTFWFLQFFDLWVQNIRPLSPIDYNQISSHGCLLVPSGTTAAPRFFYILLPSVSAFQCVGAFG